MDFLDLSPCKLQIGCLLISLYVIGLYAFRSYKTGISCNRLFDAIAAIIPWAIFFDGFTAWTVNNQNLVSPQFNLVAHILFFVLMDATVYVTYFYMRALTKGAPKRLGIWILNVLPFAVSLVLIFAFSSKIEFVQGKTTAYSRGVSAYACFVSCYFYFFLALVSTLVKVKHLEHKKLVAVRTIVSVSFAIMTVQIIFPEFLFTSVASTMLVLGLYMNIEDPSIQQLKNYNHNSIMSFSTLVENRDNNTGGHIKRTRDYVKILLEKMKGELAFRNILTKDFELEMIHAAPMHDIGKISTPDVILQKPGKLTDDEYAIMKKHAENGGEIIKTTFAGFDDPVLLETSYQVARFHHEKWNGRGYPEGLKGEEIPLCARIMAIADVFDAVSAKRCYRDALPLDVCFKIIEEGIGTDFDPVLARLFLSARDEITDYYNKNYEE